MKTVIMDHGFCLKCGAKYDGKAYKDFECTELLEDGKKCGCHSIVLSDNFIRTKDGLMCTCGNEKFETVMHMDFSNYAKTVYKCTKCGNSITVDTYRDMC